MFESLWAAPRDAILAFALGMMSLTIAVMSLAAALGLAALTAVTPFPHSPTTFQFLTLGAVTYALTGALCGLYYESRVMSARYETERGWFGD